MSLLLDLSCSTEAANDKVSSYSIQTCSDESSIISIFDAESDQILASQIVQPFIHNHPRIVTARQDAISWMLKVHAHYKFRPETAYLSVIYMDRFLASHSLPQGKTWALQLVSVACLALAAKMEETWVPLLLDLQIMGPRFLFKPTTVRRMELLVLTSLKWQLRAITPFDFLHFFVTKLSCLAPRFDHHHHHHHHHIVLRASDVIVSTCQVIDFLDFSPSTIAAAAVLLVTGQNVDDQKFGCFHKRLTKEMVKKCHILMQHNICPMVHIKRQSPVGALDVALGGSCESRNNT